MFALVCSRCRIELRVPNSLAGCLIRCHECDAVTRAPRPEEEDDETGTTFSVRASQHTPRRNQEIEDFVHAMEEKARQEAEKVPYSQKKSLPLDLIAGLLLVGTGLGLLLWTMLAGGGSGMFFTLIFGVLLPVIIIIIGAMCLLVWKS